MTPKVKICGITNLADARHAARCGADFLGFVFYKKSKRCIPPSEAAGIMRHLSSSVSTVGVFVNEPVESVKKIVVDCQLDFLQFHGTEDVSYVKQFEAERVIKAVRLKDARSLDGLEAFGRVLFLFDTFKPEQYGGTGEVFDWSLLEASLEKIKRPFFVSGGLTCTNVASLLERVRPFAVDASSGLEESPGRKDARLVRRFIETVKKSSVNIASE